VLGVDGVWGTGGSKLAESGGSSKRGAGRGEPTVDARVDATESTRPIPPTPTNQLNNHPTNQFTGLQGLLHAAPGAHERAHGGRPRQEGQGGRGGRQGAAVARFSYRCCDCGGGFGGGDGNGSVEEGPEGLLVRRACCVAPCLL
jgi:hypothetical protein